MDFRRFEKPHVISDLRFGSKFLESVGLRAGLALAREVMMNLVRDEETNLQL
jgi:hypothetical protein